MKVWHARGAAALGALALAAASPAVATRGAAQVPAARDDARGRALYMQTCAVCHMAEGKGLAGLQPPLVGSARLAGDPKLLIDLMLRGSKLALPPSATYTNEMPSFAQLPDADIAALLSYTRSRFGKGLDAVAAADVTAARRKLGTPAESAR